MIPIGSQIYLRRLEQNLTQVGLAKKVGIPQPNLSNIEKGKQDITVSTLRKIAVAFNIHPAEFFKDTGEVLQSSLSRQRIEQIAKKIAQKPNPSRHQKDQLVSLYQKVLPYKGRIRVKELQKSWLELRSKCNSQEINAVQERVAEYKRRK